MKKEYLKKLASQLAIQTLFVAADQMVREVVSKKLKTRWRVADEKDNK